MNILMIEHEYATLSQNAQTHACSASIRLAHAFRALGKAHVTLLVKENSFLEQKAKAYNLSTFSCPEGFTASFQISQFIKKNDISCIHSFDYTSAVLASSVKFLMSQLLFVHSENYLRDNISVFKSKPYKKAQAIVFADEEAKAHALPLLDESKVSVIPTGIFLSDKYLDIEKQLNYAFSEYRASYKNEKKRFRFLVQGSLLMQRGLRDILLALQALDQLQADIPPWEVHFSGLGEEIYDLIACANELKIMDKVAVFCQPEFEDFLQTGDAIILPSHLNEPETHTILAAWKAKLPIVCTAIPAYSSLLKNKENAVIAEQQTASSLAGALLKIIQDEGLRTTLINNGLHEIQNYPTELFAVQYSTLYTKLLKKSEAK